MSIQGLWLQQTKLGNALSLSVAFRAMCGGVDYADLDRLAEEEPSAMLRVSFEDLKSGKLLASQLVPVRSLLSNTPLSMMLPRVKRPTPVGLYICRDRSSIGSCGRYRADKSGKRGVLYFSSLILGNEKLYVPSKSNYKATLDNSLQSITPSSLARQLIIPFARCPQARQKKNGKKYAS